MRLIDKISWIGVWIAFIYLISIPIRIMYDGIKKGWFNKNE